MIVMVLLVPTAMLYLSLGICSMLGFSFFWPFLVTTLTLGCVIACLCGGK